MKLFNKSKKKKLYYLRRDNIDLFLLQKAFYLILWYAGLVIDEDTYNALPPDCKELFIKQEEDNAPEERNKQESDK